MRVCNKCKKEKKEKEFYLWQGICKACRIEHQKILNAEYKRKSKLPLIVKEMMKIYDLTQLPTRTQIEDYKNNRVYY